MLSSGQLPDSAISSVELPDRLAGCLAKSLPGDAAWRPFAPRLAYGRHQGPPSHDARPAAVLVLLVPDESGWRLPLTTRPTNLTQHAGQVSFPGGRLEMGETPEQAAVRECEEELGVAADRLRILGRLSPIYIFNSNFFVTPCVASISERPEWRPNPAEVNDLLEPTLVELLARHNHSEIDLKRRGHRFPTPCIRFQNHVIWGATCMILGEFLAVLESLDQPPSGHGV